MPPVESFLPLFPSNVTNRPDGSMPDRVLVDGTPDYLFNPVAAPRIKAVVPQARFVIILRVLFLLPPFALMSMIYWWACGLVYREQLCVAPHHLVRALV